MNRLSTLLVTITMVATVTPLAAQSLPRGSTGSDPTFYIDNVDEPPSRLSAPALRYPTMLYRAGVEGEVVVEFVIDETGRADQESIRIIQSTNKGFIRAAEDFVRGSEYTPARRAGVPVSIMVQQQVQFKLTRSER